MPRSIRFVLSLAATVAFVAGGRQAHAQSAGEAPAATVDSTRPRQLGAVVVTAERARVTREGVLWLMEENIRLARVLREQDRKVEELEQRLTHLRTTVTDSVNRQITALDASAQETRARRLALEARLAALEGSQTAAGTTP